MQQGNQNEEIYEIINLGPDMGSIWGKILSTLRDTDLTLYSICTSNVDTTFEQETIILTLKDEAMFTILNKHKETIIKNAHPTQIEIILSKKAKKTENEKINKLKEIFKDRLIIK